MSHPVGILFILMMCSTFSLHVIWMPSFLSIRSCAFWGKSFTGTVLVALLLSLFWVFRPISSSSVSLRGLLRSRISGLCLIFCRFALPDLGTNLLDLFGFPGTSLSSSEIMIRSGPFDRGGLVALRLPRAVALGFDSAGTRGVAFRQSQKRWKG